MIFNETLIPQDSFTETNVTCKRSRRRKFPIIYKKTFLFKIFYDIDGLKLNMIALF